MLNALHHFDNEDSPWLFLLHGYGSNHQDLFSFKGLIPNFNIYSIEAPIDLPFGGKAWFEISFDGMGVKDYDKKGYADSLQQIEEFIDAKIKEHNISRDKNYMMGFSQGGAMSIGYALENQDKLKHVILTSSVVSEELLDMDVYEQVPNFDLDVFMSHGLQDEVVPYEKGSMGRALLEKLEGVRVQFFDYPMGHTISQENLNDLNKWITQSRVTA